MPSRVWYVTPVITTEAEERQNSVDIIPLHILVNFYDLKSILDIDLKKLLSLNLTSYSLL